MRDMRYWLVAAAVIAALVTSTGCGGGGGSTGPEDEAQADVDEQEGVAEVDAGPCVDGEACNDGDPCTENDLCNAGECSGTPKSCDDGVACNGDEVCNAVTGQCDAGTPPDLDDGVACTLDECDEEAGGVVVHTPDHAGCDDGDPCTDNVCDEVEGCKSSTNAAPCDDDDPCTENDVCAAGACQGDAKDCDDGLWCTGSEKCEAESGECVSEGAPELDDGVDCTVDECDEDQKEVTHDPDDTACDDGNVCTLDSCHPTDGCVAENVKIECDDGDLCTIEDQCGDGLCAGTAKPCDDGEWCNGFETCDGLTGDCVPGEEPLVNEMVGPCQNWLCDEATDEIIYFPDPSLCGDGLYCNGEEICTEAMTCAPGVPPVVDDGIACTVDTCSDADGAVFNEPSDALCDDAAWCNGFETCDAAAGCLPGTAPVLDDLVGCTDDTCDEENDLVLNTPNDGLCTNEVFCDGPEVCDAVLGCLPGEVPVTDDAIDCTADSCDEDKDTVVHLPVDLPCDDSDICTDDVCNPEVGCENPFNVADCDDNDPCTIYDVCAEGVCAGAPMECSDNKWCTGDEYCEGGECKVTPAPVVDDGVACTVDSCNEELDMVVHAPDDMLCDDANECTSNICELVGGCKTTNLEKACSDNDPCTDGDVCVAGVCESGAWTCEDCLDEVDNNVDGFTDCCDTLCVADPACEAETKCSDGKDNDCDDATDCDDPDCNADDYCIPDQGHIVITEIMANPKAVGDEFGEWFEVLNVSQLEYDLEGMIVTDSNLDAFIVAGPLVIQPGQRLVFGRNADPALNGGVNVNYGYTNFSLAQGGDEIVLAFGELVVDKVAYSTELGFTVPNGASMQLDPGSTTAAANDSGINWCASLAKVGTDFYATPGAANVPCSETACANTADDDLDTLVDCADPSCQGFDNCPEFECTDGMDNDKDGGADCDDTDCSAIPECVDSDGDGVPDLQDLCPDKDDKIDVDADGLPDLCEIEWMGEVWPTAGTSFDNDEDIDFYIQVYMPGVTDAEGQGGNVAVKMLYRTAGVGDFTEVFMTYNKDLGNNDEYKATVPASGTSPNASLEIDFKGVYLTGGPAIQYNNDPVADQNDAPVPLLYPITTEAIPPLPGEIVITEIMYDPKGTLDTPVADSAGEWFELYNTSNHPISLEGIQVTDGSQSFMINVPLVIQSGAYLVLGNNDDAATNGGVPVGYKYNGSGFQLANSQDKIILKAGAVEIDNVNYKPGQSGWPAGTSGSAFELSVSKYVDDNNVGGNWCHAIQVLPGADKGTPGKVNDCNK